MTSTKYIGMDVHKGQMAEKWQFGFGLTASNAWSQFQLLYATIEEASDATGSFSSGVRDKT